MGGGNSQMIDMHNLNQNQLGTAFQSSEFDPNIGQMNIMHQQ